MIPLQNLIFLLISVITKGHLFRLITLIHSIYCMWGSDFMYLTSLHWLSAARSSTNRLQFPSQSLLVSLLREPTFGHCGTLSLNNSSQRPKPNMRIWLPICIFTLPSAFFPSVCYRQRLEISWLLFIFSDFILSYPHSPYQELLCWSGFLHLLLHSVCVVRRWLTANIKKQSVLGPVFSSERNTFKPDRCCNRCASSGVWDWNNEWAWRVSQNFMQKFLKSNATFFYYPVLHHDTFALL